MSLQVGYIHIDKPSGGSSLTPPLVVDSASIGHGGQSLTGVSPVEVSPVSMLRAGDGRSAKTTRGVTSGTLSGAKF